MDNLSLDGDGVPLITCVIYREISFGTQSQVVTQLTLLVALTNWHQFCSVKAEPLHCWTWLARPHGGSRLCTGLS